MHQKIVFREHGQTAVGGQAYPPWVRTCNGVPHTAMACMLPVCSTTPPSFSNYLTHTLLSQGCRAPVQEFFFLPPQPRLRWQKEKKIPCHRTGGHNHNPAVTQAPGAMLLWPKGPVAEFRRYPIAAVCPHVRIGGQRAAPAVAVLCVPTPTAAAAAVYCPKIFSRIGLCTPGVGVYT